MKSANVVEFILLISFLLISVNVPSVFLFLPFGVNYPPLSGSPTHSLLSGELLAECCCTDDLMPSIPFLCLPPSRVYPKVLGLKVLIYHSQPGGSWTTRRSLPTHLIPLNVNTLPLSNHPQHITTSPACRLSAPQIQLNS